MRHFPIFVDMTNRNIAVIGGNDVALAKLRVLLKTCGAITVFTREPAQEIKRWAEEGRLTLNMNAVTSDDLREMHLIYIAGVAEGEAERIAGLGRAQGAWVNIVDNLDESDFITPAIVDRDPVTVAIGTEGTAPVLARKIKALNEEALSPDIGTLARIAKKFRPQVAGLPEGRARRDFWSRYYDDVGRNAYEAGGEEAVEAALMALLRDSHAQEKQTRSGHVSLIGAGPGDPELLTLKARRILHQADVVIYDRLVSHGILELARREAKFFEVGKTPGGPSWKQDDINDLIVEQALGGARVARLKGGDPVVFGRLDEEMAALDKAGIGFDIVPGVTAASASAAAIKTSWTKRGRNSNFRILTGHDVKGFAEHDWKTLAASGSAAAIYMGVRAARFLQGRLMVHGANFDTPMTIVENASRPEQKVIATTLRNLQSDIETFGVSGPAILFFGLSPREAQNRVDVFQSEGISLHAEAG